MFFRARRALNRAWFDAHCRSVLQTPPLPPSNSSVTVASMLCHGDLLMYLLAIKSFVRQLGEVPRVVVLNDGSLTAQDLETLHHHIPSFAVVGIKTIDRGVCPKGGAWELLLMIADLVQHSYVVQVDSDTLTLGPVPEVNECIATTRNFSMLGDRSYPQVESMLDACARSKTNLHPHVQALCERSFDLLPESKDLKYLRGNAGFLGFPKGSIDRKRVQWFSDLMRRITDEKWNEWGSEQVTTNLLTANSDNPFPLPALKYLTYWDHPEIPYDQASFLHFVGPHRYTKSFYINKARKVLGMLR